MTTGKRCESSFLADDLHFECALPAPQRKWPLALLVSYLLLPATLPAEVTLKIGDREEVLDASGKQIPTAGIDTYVEAPLLSLNPDSDVVLFEGRAYRELALKWEKDTTVSIHLYGQMRNKAAAKPDDPRYVVKDCGRLTVGDGEWTLGPDDLVCDNNFIDKSALIEFRIEDAAGGVSFAYVRIFNRRFPLAGSDAGIVLTLTERMKSSDDEDDGFTATNGISVYYAVSRLKSQRFRGIVHVAALDQIKDDKDLEVGLGFGLLFKSNGFMDTKTGLSLAGGIGYNLMVPKSSERWYWFVGLGTNFDLGKGK